MRSDKSSQSPQNQKGSDQNAEIITPLKVRRSSGQGDSSSPRRLKKISVSLLLIVLVVMVAGGFFFVRHIAKHPVNLTDDSGQTVQSEGETPVKQDLDAAKINTEQADRLTLPDPISFDDHQAVESQQRPDPAEETEKPDELSRLIESGRKHEKNNMFAFALTDYQEALKLDPESVEAQEALNRVKRRIVDEQFQKLMSDGLTAYHKGSYQSARTTLLKAKSFRPDSREVRNALVQVDEAIRLDNIEKLRQKAITAEKTDDWEQALKSYLAVLKIDSNISFAVQGKKRSLEQIRVAKRIAIYLQKPDILESNQQLQNAVLLIEEAETLQPRGQRLGVQLDKLKALVDAARTPVTVMIESDNLTEVAVYKVGRLGRFATRELLLRPGTYTVVGSRDGYKDVRQKIIIKPQKKTVRITVICRNKV